MDQDSKIKVLLIEDNPGDARLLREILAEIKGAPFELDWANCLSEGMERFDKGRADVVLLDLSLPDSKGLKTLEGVHSKAHDIPIVVMTGLDDEITALEAIRKGAQDYLVKGEVDSKLLSRVIRYAMERNQIEQELKKITLDLQASNKELEQFAYVASHDLQEPLRMIKSYAQLLVKNYQGKLDANADEFIHYMVDGAGQMSQLVTDLLAYARVGTRGRDFELIECEEAFDRCITNLQAAIQETGAQVTHDDLPMVMADPSQMVQLLQNLIGNAIKFHGTHPPRIHVSAEKDGGRWLFSVRDNGIGIDPKHSEAIFTIFQRLHSRAEYPGTGIGLAICKKIVERHGGKIWVESRPGKGSIFYFTVLGGGGKLVDDKARDQSFSR